VSLEGAQMGEQEYSPSSLKLIGLITIIINLSFIVDILHNKSYLTYVTIVLNYLIMLESLIMRKSFFLLSLALLAGTASFSPSGWAMNRTDKEEPIAPHAKLSAPDMEWPDFDEFLGQHTLSKEEVMGSICGNPENSKFSANPSEHSCQMKLLGIKSYLNTFSAGVAKELNGWIATAGYKNFPDSPGLTPEGEKLSKICKPYVDSLNTLLEKSEESINGMDPTLAIPALTALLKKSTDTLWILKSTESLVKELKTSKPLEGNVPDVKMFTGFLAAVEAPPAPLSEQHDVTPLETFTGFLAALPASPVPLGETPDFRSAPLEPLRLPDGKADAVPELAAIVQQGPVAMPVPALDQGIQKEWDTGFTALVQAYPEISVAAIQDLINEHPDWYSLSSEPTVKSCQIQAMAIRSYSGGLYNPLYTLYHEWRQKIGYKNNPESGSEKATKQRWEGYVQETESVLGGAERFGDGLSLFIDSGAHLPPLEKASGLFSTLKASLSGLRSLAEQ
jgi:hypothetical protein